MDRISADKDRTPETSLCVLPWIHTYVGISGYVQLCCVSGTGETSAPVLGSVRESSLAGLFHSDAMEKVRRLMLAGIWPVQCSYCQKKEERGMKSSRQLHNVIHHSFYAQLLEKPDRFVPKIRSVDLRLDNVCNFTCRSCSGYASSSWFAEHNLIYPDISMSQSTIGLEDATSFWREFREEILPELEFLHLAGGEPLVSVAHYRLLESLIQSGNTSVALYYDTNLSRLTFKEWNAVELWFLFPVITICLSLDGVGRKGEYIRHGLDYGQWRKNLATLRRELPQARYKMHFVVSIFNVMELGLHLRTILGQGFVGRDRLRLTFLQWPPYLNVQVLTPALKKECERGLRELIEDETLGEPLLSQLRALLHFVNERELYPEYGAELADKVARLDRLRGEQTGALFPYLEPMLMPTDNGEPYHAP